jgi:hypothetical protein
MWERLTLHKTAGGWRCVWVSVCVLASVSMCNIHFSPRPQHGALQILVHVDVALHRGFICPSHAGKAGWRLLLCRVPPSPYIKRPNRSLPPYRPCA